MDVSAYLARIGYHGPRRVDGSTLAALQRAHLLAVPFDSLDCYLGRRVTVAPADAYQKVVGYRRGGFCFELNGLFGWLLAQLGFPVTPLGAQVYLDQAALTPPYSHLVLLVELERRWLVDVGFGHPFALEPLDVDVREAQYRSGRRFQITAADGGEAPVADGGGALVAEELGVPGRRGYQFTMDPAPQRALVEQCQFYSADPQSPFVRSAPVTRMFEDGWVTVTRDRASGMRGGVPFEQPIEDESQWLAVLERHTGLAVRDRQVYGSVPAG